MKPYERVQNGFQLAKRAGVFAAA